MKENLPPDACESSGNECERKGCGQYDRTNELKALKHFEGKLQGDSWLHYDKQHNNIAHYSPSFTPQVM